MGRVRAVIAAAGLLAALVMAGAGPAQAEPGGQVEIAEVGVPRGALSVEVMRTDEQRGTGMMGRPQLRPGHGMAFVYAPPREVFTWMLDTDVPLDMVFVRDDTVIKVVTRARPCPELPCRTYASRAPVDLVIEVAAGQARALGLRPGAVVTHTLTSP